MAVDHLKHINILSETSSDILSGYPQVLGRDPQPNILDPFLVGLKCFAICRL